MKESTVQKKIIAYLNTIGYCVKIISANKSGRPDLLCCVDGKFYAFEVKRSDGGVTSDLQWINILKIRDAGGIAHVVSSLEEVKEILEGNR